MPTTSTSSILGSALSGAIAGGSSGSPATITTNNVRKQTTSNQAKLQQLNAGLVGASSGMSASLPQNQSIVDSGVRGAQAGMIGGDPYVQSGTIGAQAGIQGGTVSPSPSYYQTFSGEYVQLPKNENNYNQTNLKQNDNENNSSTEGRVNYGTPSFSLNNNNDQNTQTNTQSQEFKTPETNLPPIPEAPEIDSRMKEMEAQLEEYNKLLDAQKASLDETNKAMVSSIQESFNRRRAQVEEINKRYLAGLNTANMASGLSQYASQMSDMILSAEERAGIQRLTDLDSQEKQEILQANIANQEKNFQLLDKRLNKIDELRKEKSQIIQQQFENTMATEKANRERIREEQDMKFKTDQMNMEAKRFAMEQDKFNFERQERVKKQQADRAASIAIQMVDLDDGMNVVTPDMKTIAEIARDAGIDPNILASEISRQANDLRKSSLEERKFMFDQYRFGSDQALDQERMKLEQAKFNLDKYNTQFNQQIKLEELNSKASGLGLSPAQINDAVSKGYKTEAELALYRQQVAGGIQPAPLKEKSSEQRKLEANTLSGISSISTLRDSLTNSIGRGKLFNGEYKAAESNLLEVIANLKTGAAFSEAQEKRFRDLLPSAFRSDEVNKANLKELENQFINIIGRENFQEEKKKVYADVSTFQRFGTKEETKEFDSFMRSMSPKPGDDINDYFDVFRKQKGFNQPLSMGVNGSLQKSFAQKYPEGVRGGQCASFARKLVDIPPLGDGLNDKKAHVDKIGIPASQWRQNPQIGDVVITNENPTYGHVFVVNKIFPDGRIQVTESNFKRSETVSHDRVIPLSSSKIYGAIRAPLKVNISNLV